MPFVPTPPTRVITPLWGLGFRFETLSLKFAHLAHDIENVWILGPYLAIPFGIISIAFMYAQQEVWEADLVIGLALSWLDSLLDGWLIIDLIGGLWSEFSELRQNPIIWVLNKIITLWSEFNQIRQNPLIWLRYKLTNLIPEIWYLFNNTRQWFLGVLQNYWPNIYSLFINPGNTVRNWIYGFWPSMRSFISNPAYYVFTVLTQRYPVFQRLILNTQTTIINHIFGRYPDLVFLFTNPIGWLSSKFRLLTNTPIHSFRSFYVNVILNSLSTLAHNDFNLTERIKGYLCDIVMYFM